ncbi:MAG: hypothetical protein J3K34DRAFT_499776, partial [Monoraphidium minutum]
AASKSTPRLDHAAVPARTRCPRSWCSCCRRHISAAAAASAAMSLSPSQAAASGAPATPSLDLPPGDRLVAALDVVVCSAADALGGKVVLLQQPLRHAGRPYELANAVSARLRPGARRLELELPLDTQGPNYDPGWGAGGRGARAARGRGGGGGGGGSSGSGGGGGGGGGGVDEGGGPPPCGGGGGGGGGGAPMERLLLRSEVAESGGAQYAVGVVRDGRLLLVPVDYALQLRPHLTHLDSGGEEGAGGGAAEEEAEEWQPLQVSQASCATLWASIAPTPESEAALPPLQPLTRSEYLGLLTRGTGGAAPRAAAAAGGAGPSSPGGGAAQWLTGDVDPLCADAPPLQPLTRPEYLVTPGTGGAAPRATAAGGAGPSSLGGGAAQLLTGDFDSLSADVAEAGGVPVFVMQQCRSGRCVARASVASCGGACSALIGCTSASCASRFPVGGDNAALLEGTRQAGTDALGRMRTATSGGRGSALANAARNAAAGQPRGVTHDYGATRARAQFQVPAGVASSGAEVGRLEERRAESEAAAARAPASIPARLAAAGLAAAAEAARAPAGGGGPAPPAPLAAGPWATAAGPPQLPVYGQRRTRKDFDGSYAWVAGRDADLLRAALHLSGLREEAGAALVWNGAVRELPPFEQITGATARAAAVGAIQKALSGLLEKVSSDEMAAVEAAGAAAQAAGSGGGSESE